MGYSYPIRPPPSDSNLDPPSTEEILSRLKAVFLLYGKGDIPGNVPNGLEGDMEDKFILKLNNFLNDYYTKALSSPPYAKHRDRIEAYDQRYQALQAKVDVFNNNSEIAHRRYEFAMQSTAYRQASDEISRKYKDDLPFLEGMSEEEYDDACRKRWEERRADVEQLHRIQAAEEERSGFTSLVTHGDWATARRKLEENEQTSGWKDARVIQEEAIEALREDMKKW